MAGSWKQANGNRELGGGLDTDKIEKDTKDKRKEEINETVHVEIEISRGRRLGRTQAEWRSR